MCVTFFFSTDSATTETSTLSLHDALPICVAQRLLDAVNDVALRVQRFALGVELDVRLLELRHRDAHLFLRSEEHTSELQSRFDLVCRLLLEKKKSRN